MFDVIVVGGGPAGLSAALVLGRCCRSVLVLDDATARNAVSSGVHGFLGHDGVPPAELRDIARAELAPYDVELRSARATAAVRGDEGFVVTDASGAEHRGHKLLIATGVHDRLPDIAGARELYGRGVYPCVYCDGWELRGQPLAAFGGAGASCREFALGLTTWSKDVVLFTHGEAVDEDDASRLARNGVVVHTDRVTELVSTNGALSHVVLVTGERVPRAALFLHMGQTSASSLAEVLGCHAERSGVVDTFGEQRTCVPGVYLAGDASHDVKFAIVAAAHGARAAHDINQVLREERTR